MAFNWKPNPYFTPNAYVSIAGNDLNDGTAQRPYRSIQKAKDAGKSLLQVGPGSFNESPGFGGNIFFESSSVVDGFGKSGAFATGQNFYRGILKNNIPSSINNTIRFYNCKLINTYRYDENVLICFDSCLIKNLNFASTWNYIFNPNFWKKSTFYNCELILPNKISLLQNNAFGECIFHSTKLTFQGTTEVINSYFLSYCLFFNCQFKFGNGVYKTIQTIEAETGLTGIDALRKAHQNYFGGSIDVFKSCIITDPLFNDINNDDFSLKPLSPARHLAFNGTYVGAFDVAFPIRPYADDINHPDGFYNASKGANILASNTKLSLARNPDGSAVGGGQITTKPQDFGAVYELRTVLASQQIADRNREWIDTNADIDMTAPIYPGTAITVGESYVVEGGSVVYNSVTYTTRNKFIAVAGQTAFTSPDGAYLYLIKETPNRATVEMRMRQTLSGVIVTPGNNLTDGSWYKAVGAVNWNSKVIPDGDSFQAVTGALSFTGGNCVEIFTDADVWYEVEIGDKPVAKRVGNVQGGAFDVGTDGKPLSNGHKEFYTTTNQARASFMMQARYIQYRITFQNKMLK